MKNFEFIDAVGMKKAYKGFINEKGSDMESIFNNLHNYIKDTFHARKESGVSDGELKGKMNIIINLIKFTDLKEDVICKVIGIDDSNENWVRFVKETGEKLK